MELLNKCRDQAHHAYGDLLLAATQSLNNTLFEQADNATTNEEQQRFFEAMQVLKTNHEVIQAAFRESIETSYNTFVSGSEETQAVEATLDLTNLSLVQRDDLEDELAISVIVSKSNSRNSEHLWKLNRRLAVLRGGKNVVDETNPFGPQVICEAIQEAISKLDMDSKARLLIYKHMGKILLVSFGKILEQLNNLLIEQGILPNLRFMMSKEKKSTPKPQKTTNTHTDSEPEEDSVVTTPESPSSVAHQQALYQSIRQLQAKTTLRTETAGGIDLAGVQIDGVAGRQDTFSATDYKQAIQAIQQSNTMLSSPTLDQPLSADAVEEKLFNQLAKQGTDDSPHKMTHDDADTVDLVGMIFRYMLDDTELHDVVKSILSHLHTPYLKLALMDKTFLDNHSHDARVLLNRMAEVGARWVKSEKDRNALPKIKDTVETILTGFTDDITLFNRLLEDFTRFAENLEKRSRMVEKRNTEAQQGLERLEIAKQQANDEIEQRLIEAAIPGPIADILRKPWSDFLSFSLLRYGNDSQTWHSSLKVVDGVVWSIRADPEKNSSKEDFHHKRQQIEQSVGCLLYTSDAADE